MTPQQFINKLNNLALNEQGLDRVLFMAVKSVQSEMGIRIFEKGKASDGSSIGKYSKKPLYVSDNNSPIRGSHLGKPNQDGKRRKIKTTYYESYESYRSQQGRDSSNVNLRLFGRLQSNFLNAPVRRKLLNYSIVLSPENVVKLRGNEKRFQKKIGSLTQSERQLYKRVINFEFKKLLAGS